MADALTACRECGTLAPLIDLLRSGYEPTPAEWDDAATHETDPSKVRLDAEIDLKARALIFYQDLKPTIPSPETRAAIVAEKFDVHPNVVAYAVVRQGDGRVKRRAAELRKNQNQNQNSDLSESNSDAPPETAD
jgi:hypothetical protein